MRIGLVEDWRWFRRDEWLFDKWIRVWAVGRIRVWWEVG